MHLTDYTVAPSSIFELPPDNDRKSLRVGDNAKVVFNVKDAPCPEQMFVKVTKVVCPGIYVGELNSTPLFPPMVPGEVVVFEWRHVIDIFPAEADTDTGENVQTRLVADVCNVITRTTS